MVIHYALGSKELLRLDLLHTVRVKRKPLIQISGRLLCQWGNVALHWTATAAQDQDETDGDKLRRFVSGLHPRAIIRHHIAGDIGEETHN